MPPKKAPATKKQAADEAAAKVQRYAATNAENVRNSSIITEGATINTVVGPIHGWKCVPENLPNHPTMAFFGKRRTGKSTSITNIAFHCFKKIPFGIVMSDTAYAGKLPMHCCDYRIVTDSEPVFLKRSKKLGRGV